MGPRQLPRTDFQPGGALRELANGMPRFHSGQLAAQTEMYSAAKSEMVHFGTLNIEGVGVVKVLGVMVTRCQHQPQNRLRGQHGAGEFIGCFAHPPVE